MTELSHLPLYRASSPEDLLNALPALYSFVPAESVMAICVSGRPSRLGFRLRLDLPASGRPDDLDPAAQVVARHAQQQCGQGPDDGVMLVAVSRHPPLAEESIHRVMDLLRAPVPLAMWATEDTYWLLDPDAPAEGVSWTRDPAHESIVMAIAQGQTIWPSREAMAAQFAPVGGPRRALLEHAYLAVRRDVTGREAEVVRELVARDLGGEPLKDGDLLALAAAVRVGVAREKCWVPLDRKVARAHADLWTRVSRVAPAEAAPWALALAGFAWWLTGDGAQAATAAERALTLAPDHDLGGIVMAFVQGAVNPDDWPTLRGGLMEVLGTDDTSGPSQ